MQTCPICGAESKECFSGTIMKKYQVKYYKCTQCGFLRTEQPFWLEEAYADTMNKEDTGLLKRNILHSEWVATILYFCFKRDGIYLDYAGGYGTFTRLMRDIGFDFYWHDPFTNNLFARGFEYSLKKHKKIELVTSFESFEHFADPISEIEKMFKIAPNILFSTILLPSPEPKLDEWWYYGLDHGQHVSFYTQETCRHIAKRFNLNFYSFGEFHLFSAKPLNIKWIRYLLRINSWGLDRFVRAGMRSKTRSDYQLLCQEKEGRR